jgi:hypothetical protein
MIPEINPQPMGRILAASGRSKKENTCKPTKILKPSHFKRKRGDQISQETKVFRRNASKSGPSKPPKPKIFTAKTQSTQRSTRQVRISCLPLRSLRLRGENSFILLRFFTAEKFCNLPARRNHLASLIGGSWPRMGFSGTTREVMAALM